MKMKKVLHRNTIFFFSLNLIKQMKVKKQEELFKIGASEIS